MSPIFGIQYANEWSCSALVLGVGQCVTLEYCRVDR
jgi:hypothetical protein